MPEHYDDSELPGSELNDRGCDDGGAGGREPHGTGPHEAPRSHLEELLAERMSTLEEEHVLLQAMWNTPGPDANPDAKQGAPSAVTDGDDVTDPAGPGHVTVLHQARALTVGDLRAALVGFADDQPVAIDVPLDPGGLELHRHVLTSTATAVLLLADEEEVLDPSLVLRADFPTGMYEIPLGAAASGTHRNSNRSDGHRP